MSLGIVRDLHRQFTKHQDGCVQPQARVSMNQVWEICFLARTSFKTIKNTLKLNLNFTEVRKLSTRDDINRCFVNSCNLFVCVLPSNRGT